MLFNWGLNLKKKKNSKTRYLDLKPTTLYLLHSLLWAHLSIILFFDDHILMHSLVGFVCQLMCAFHV